jgi:carbon-monoxide dehydrogenase small subunit
MSEIELSLMVNGVQHSLRVDPHETLLRVLREQLALPGTKDGCSQGDCGACVVLLDGQAVNACLVLAVQAEDTQVLTVEALAPAGKLHPLQQAFADKWGFQCGFCTPGILMAAYALLLQNPDPSDRQIKLAISGNLCRCTGYDPIVASIRHAATLMRESR